MGAVQRAAPLFLGLLAFVNAAIPFDTETLNHINAGVEAITWCTVSNEEQYKCGNLSMAVERDQKLFDDYYFKLKCNQGFDKDECMRLLSEDKADITNLDSGDVFVAGRFHSLIPIMQEAQPGNEKYVYSVAVVKQGSHVGSDGLRSLRGVKACFPAVGSFTGWVLPVKMLMDHGGMEIVDCNNHVKSVIEYFGKSCAPNSLLVKNNPIGDNSDKLCQLCTGGIGYRCSLNDPYAGFTGALRCLLEAGDIAFLKHSTVPFALANHFEFSSLSADKFELLCKDGSRKSIQDYLTCNWGLAPSNAIVTSTAKDSDKIIRYQRFLQNLVKFYSNGTYRNILNDTRRFQDSRGFNRDQYGNSFDSRNVERDQYGNPITRDRSFNNYNPSNRDYYGNPIPDYSSTEPTDSDLRPLEKFDLFNSTRYGKRSDLLLEDSTVALLNVDEQSQRYTEFLGQSAKTVLEIRHCPVGRFTLCVTSDAELNKCVKMKSAMKAQLLKPDMVCYRGYSQIHCMQAIRQGTADGIMLDASDIWEAARHYSLQPFLAEVYSGGNTSYYAVGVTRDNDPNTEITYLRGKHTCHSGIGKAAGWVYPLAYLVANGWIRPYGCDVARAAAEWFSRSCAPGAMSSEYNNGVPHSSLCRLCHGSTTNYCRRDASEAYYGDIGAIRCLVEGGGDVAFTRHSAVSESSGGRKREWWARDLLKDDFQLICPDGTRGSISDYSRCNLGVVPANAMVTRGGEAYNEAEIAAYTNLFMYAQQFYGTQTDDDFSFTMFSSPPPYADLIFSDGTRQLRPLVGDQRYASRYLGKIFMRAHRLTDCDPSTSGSPHMPLNNVTILGLIAAVVLYGLS